jgi:hypothetical protein
MEPEILSLGFNPREIYSRALVILNAIFIVQRRLVIGKTLFRAPPCPPSSCRLARSERRAASRLPGLQVEPVMDR